MVMSDDWDVYFTHVDGKPASMLLDLGLAGEAPIPGLSVMCYVTIDFLDPDENGMSKRGEYGRLMAIEDALVPALTHETCMFVGRCTTNGQRDFFFYMDNAKGVEDRAEAVMAKFDEYTWDMGLVEEPGWDTYLDFLYPDEQGRDTIWNNRVRRQLQENGDKGSEPREIDHWLYFPSEQDRAAFTAEVETEKFRITPLNPEPDKPFGLLVQREDAPDDIDDVTWPLRELAGAHGGTYDGWGCSVVE
jgi:uncharacterized protein (TIGR01619 family)